MHGETNRLVSVINQTSTKPELRAVDFVISTGEQISVGLMVVALREVRLNSVPFVGWQIPILTYGSYTNTFVALLNQKVLRASQLVHDVVLVTGFQGFNQPEGVSTLGRGGSDTSAVALAVAVGSDCLIYTDVKGVYTADPRLNPEAKLVRMMHYEEASEIASFGSKVVHFRSVLLSGRFVADINIISSFTCFVDRRIRTTVSFGLAGRLTMERPIATSITFRKTRMLTSLKVNLCPELLRDPLVQLVKQRLFKHEILVHSGSSDISCTIVTSDRNQTKHTENLVLKLTRRTLNVRSSQTDNRVSELSVIGLGLRQSGFMLNILSATAIRPKCLVFAEIRVTFLTKTKVLLESISKLHHYLFEQ